MHATQHIEITPGVCGGKPRVAGTRIRVQDIVVWHEVNGESPDEIVASCPSLGMADVHAALTYYYEHIDEINHQIAESEALVEAVREKANAREESTENADGDSVSS